MSRPNTRTTDGGIGSNDSARDRAARLKDLSDPDLVAAAREIWHGADDYDTLADRLGVSRRVARRRFVKLRDAGFVIKTPHNPIRWMDGAREAAAHRFGDAADPYPDAGGGSGE